MSTPCAPDDFPVIDLAAWRNGDDETRAGIARHVDHALQASGFLLVTGHGIDPALPERLRRAAHAFFALPASAKDPYRSLPGTPGWNPTGVEANGYASGTASPPDLKESLTFGPAGAGATILGRDGLLPCVNVYPAEVDGMAPLVERYLAAARALADDLLVLLGHAIGAAPDVFTQACGASPFSLLVTHYPSYRAVGEAHPGQYRIGPHTDFGTITLLDRQPGRSGLQVRALDGGWMDAPYVPGSLTINIGDLMARWTGDRWRSNLHRAPAATADAPDEALVSLVFFFEADVDAVITPLAPPLGGGRDYEPVVALDYLRAKMAAITVG